MCIPQLLIEWGANVHLKNNISKTALDLIRNKDLETFLRSEYSLCNLYSNIFYVHA